MERNETQTNVLKSAQDGDNARVVLTKMSPNVLATAAAASTTSGTVAVAGIALSRNKRSSNSSRSSRGTLSDSEQKATIKQRNFDMDIAKVTDESDGDSDNRMVINSSDSEREATATESDKDVKQNGGAQISSASATAATATSAAASKRKRTISGSSNPMSDDEDFAGFTLEDQILAKKSKSENSSPQTPPKNKNSKSVPTKVENPKSEQKIKPATHDNDISNTSFQSPGTAHTMELTSIEKPGHFITKEPRYRNPFKYGWKRELVFRANLDSKVKVENKGEVYYHTPNGKKLRTKAEIMFHLRSDEGLDIADFTFAKERIGMPQEQEIVRSAKIQTPSQRSRPSNFLDLGSPDPSLGFGKRTPKPKLPKGASPPPILAHNKSRPPNSSQKRPVEAEIIQQKAPKTNPKSSKGDPCSIQCVLAMGTIPQLQCKKCLCLYHHVCVGKSLEKFGGNLNNYICEKCIIELAEAQSSAKSAPAATTTTAPSNTTTLTNATATATASSTDKLSHEITKSLIKSNRTDNDASRRKSNTNNKLPQKSSAQNRRAPVKDGHISVAASAAPATAAVAPAKPPVNNDSKSSPPQSVAIVAGRKYIMVPKSNLKAGDANVNGVAHVNDAAQSSAAQGITKALTTGEDSTPPSNRNKKIARNITHGGSVTKPAPLVASSSVHTLFAAEFFSNISKGYDILLHTFQYLKVQELLRASRVCRMWNQVANNSILWQTVRMKNSQVNDWSGLTSALKRHGTRHLDLRKILIPPTLNWSDFLENIGDVSELQSIDLCRCPAEVVTGLFERNRNLRILNAVSINGEHLNLPTVNNLNHLTELRLKAVTIVDINSLQSLQHMKQLKHLSLTSIKGLDAAKFTALRSLTSLVTLELGECCHFTEEFGRDVLVKLINLQRLRLEKGQEKCSTFEILKAIAKLTKLAQLELVNFDIISGFDDQIAHCKHLKRILLIPTYISQSATTNNAVLAGIAKLKDTLQDFTWVVTNELINVTELYVDQCDTKRRDRRQREDKIPIMKPVPLMPNDAAILKSVSENAQSETPQVEILPLHIIEGMVKVALPKLKLKIVKVPFHATWRETMSDV